MGLFNIGFNTGFHRRSGFVQPPFQDDLDFDFFARDVGSLTLQDNIASNDAAVVGGVVGVFDGASDAQPEWDTELQDFDISFCVYHDNVGSFEAYLAYMGQVGGTLDKSGITIRKNSNNKISLFYHPTTTTDIVVQSNSTLLAETWYSLRFIKIDTEIKMYINGVLDKTDTVSSSVINYSDDGRNLIGKYNSNLAYSFPLLGMMCDVSIDSISSIHLNNHTYDSITGIEATNNGVTFANVTDYTPPSTLEALDSGYIELSTGEQIINPQFDYSGLDYTLHEGGKMHNFIESYIQFPSEDIFDRSNTTIYGDDARKSATDSEYYDSSNPHLWHISELNYDTWQSYLNTAYKERNFTGIKTNYGNQLEIFRILSYATQKSGQDLIDVLDYINYNYLPDGYAYLLDSEGNKTYDSNGSVLTTPI